MHGLGFVVDWQQQFEMGFPLFLQVTRQGQTPFLTEHTGDCEPGGAVYLIVPDVHECARQFTSRGVTGFSVPERTPWGTGEMIVNEPDGNRLRFASDSEEPT